MTPFPMPVTYIIMQMLIFDATLHKIVSLSFKDEVIVPVLEFDTETILQIF